MFSGTLVGDLDGDGPEEVVAVANSNFFEGGPAQLRVWEHDGRPRWIRDLLNPAGHPVLFDWDGRAGLDIVTLQGPIFEVFSGSGDALFSRPHGGPLPCGIQCSYTFASDVSGDGVPDLVVDSVALSAGQTADGGAVFAVDGATGQVLWEFAPGCGFGLAPPAALPGPAGPRVLLACRSAEGGIPGPGDSVLFAVDTRPVLEAPAATPGLMEAKVAWTTPFASKRGHSKTAESLGDFDVISIVVGDVTGDGRLDVVAMHRQPQAIHVIDADDGRIVYSASDLPEGANSMALGNLDADPQVEILRGSRVGRIAAFDVTADGLSQRWESPPLANGSSALATADLDGDGLDEVVAGVQDGDFCGEGVEGHVVVLSHDGVLLWSSDPLDRCAPPVRGIALADLDRDGDIEILQPAVERFFIFGVGPQPMPKEPTKE